MKKFIATLLMLSLLVCSTSALASVMVITGTPTYDDSEAMEQNLNAVIGALNGKKIEKGKPFSFNEIVGPRTEANGYASALNGNGDHVVYGAEGTGGRCRI